MDLSEDNSAQEWEEGIRSRVAEEGDATRAGVERIDDGATQADGDCRGRAQQCHGQDEAEERAGDSRALCLEREEVAAPGEHGEQADELRRRPLLSVREQDRPGD